MKTYLMIISTIIVGLGQATHTDCSNIFSCGGVTISDGAICSGWFSCESVTITGDTICSGESSCNNAYINGDVTCSNDDACPHAQIIGDVICFGEDSCHGIAITGGDITCSGDGSCFDINSDSTCVPHESISCTGVSSCIGANICTSIPTKSPTVPTKLPTAFPTKYPTSIPTKYPTSIPTKSPTLIPSKSPTSIPIISPVIIICPPDEDERTFRIHLEIPEKTCHNTPFEETVDLMKNILEQLADIHEPESFCVDLEIINVECGIYYTDYRWVGYIDVIDEAVANINAAVGTTATTMFKGELLSFTVVSNEELNDEKRLSDSSGDSSSDSSSDSFESGYNSINNIEQSENVTHGVNNVLVELNIWNYVLAFVALEICIVCCWYTKCKDQYHAT